MRDYAYYNGVFTPYDSAVIPLSDRSIFFADAVYDVILGRCGIPYQIDEHLERLMKNANAIGLGDNALKSEIIEAIDVLLEEAEADDFMLYIQLSARQKRRCHSRDELGSNILLTVTSAEIPVRLGFISAITLPDLRHAYCNVKTTNLLASVLSVMDAEALGCDTAIFRRGSMVTEASASNVSILKDNLLITHPLDRSILPGISELNLIRAAKKLEIGHERREFSVNEMMNADAVILSSTTKLIRMCQSIDGVELPSSGYEVVSSIFNEMLSDLPRRTT